MAPDDPLPSRDVLFARAGARFNPSPNDASSGGSRAEPPASAVEAALAAWRERNLGPLLFAAALLGSFATLPSLLREASLGRWALLAVHVAILLALWAAASGARARPAASSGRRPHATRGLALSALYGTGTLALFTFGVSAAEGLLAFTSFAALCALLGGPRRARAACALAVATIAASALAAATGVFATGSGSPSFDALDGLRGGLSALSVIAVGESCLFFMRRLGRALAQGAERGIRLDEEKRERERAQGQLAETQQRLLHAHKLEVVGRLAGGIAHDFNNTLTVILSYAELIKSRLGREHPVSELADQIIQAAEQGGDLTKQLLTFTRRQIVKPRTVDVQQILRNTERALTRLVPRTIRIRRSESPEELYVTVDPTQLQQAILNLALNARDAMPDGGDLFLEAGGCDLRDPGALPLIRGHYVLLRVRDTGTGMSAETKARLFEPFFTTKEPGLGTGLGLANVRETIEAAGGHVAVKSELEQGSELTLYLPRSDARISGVETMPHVRPARHHTLLVVDDEPQIREVIRTMLVDNEYVVRTADSARGALEILRTEHIDLVCTDLVMPEMSGSKLIDELKRTQPRLPVVVCSAYGTDDEVSRRVTRGEVLFLSKPFTRKELLDVVSRALSTQPQQPNGRPLAAS